MLTEDCTVNTRSSESKLIKPTNSIKIYHIIELYQVGAAKIKISSPSLNVYLNSSLLLLLPVLKDKFVLWSSDFITVLPIYDSSIAILLALTTWLCIIGQYPV